jgi:hypothetical protein
MKYIFRTIILLFSTLLFSQSKDGYWDNMRTTNETILLKAGERKAIKSADFPEGTTEIVCRVTVLDENQKIASSLVSLLKAIPDPYGIGQGSAGAVFLASTISGDDKCKYAIFKNATTATNAVGSGDFNQACFYQKEPLTKDAKLLKDKLACFTAGMQNLWFVFESDNWLMKQKIVLEIVPWVNYKASRGWTIDAKKQLLMTNEKLSYFADLQNKDAFQSSFLEQITNQYKYSEFNQLLEIEKKAALEKATKEALKKSGEDKILMMKSNDAATMQFLKRNYSKAIQIIDNQIQSTGELSDVNCLILSKCYLHLKQFDKAEKYILLGLEKDKTETSLQLQLAHVYMFTDNMKEAKALHEKYKNQNITDEESWKTQTQKDFESFEKSGLPTDKFKKILRILD